MLSTTGTFKYCYINYLYPLLLVNCNTAMETIYSLSLVPSYTARDTLFQWYIIILLYKLYSTTGTYIYYIYICIYNTYLIALLMDRLYMYIYIHIYITAVS